MGIVFKDRFPASEIITAEFVNFANEVVALRERSTAAAAKSDGAGDQSTTETGETADDGTAGHIGTVVFNSVFGNLWDQGAALERAATILEVIRCFSTVNRVRVGV